jgi:hypothetical protein
MSEWQPIETAPKNGDDILVYAFGNCMLVVCFDAENELHPWMRLDGPSYHKDAPTHWMPLPEPPAGMPRP